MTHTVSYMKLNCTKGTYIHIEKVSGYDQKEQQEVVT